MPLHTSFAALLILLLFLNSQIQTSTDRLFLIHSFRHHMLQDNCHLFPLQDSSQMSLTVHMFLLRYPLHLLLSVHSSSHPQVCLSHLLLYDSFLLPSLQLSYPLSLSLDLRLLLYLSPIRLNLHCLNLHNHCLLHYPAYLLLYSLRILRRSLRLLFLHAVLR